MRIDSPGADVHYSGCPFLYQVEEGTASMLVYYLKHDNALAGGGSGTIVLFVGLDDRYWMIGVSILCSRRNEAGRENNKPLLSLYWLLVTVVLLLFQSFTTHVIK